MNQKYHIALTDEDRTNIQTIVNEEQVSKTVRQRANILLLLDTNAGKPPTQKEIAMRCGTSDVTVFHTARDYCNHGLEYTLKFKRTKSTNPPIVIGEVEAHIIALACGEPPKGFAKWTVRLLTEKVIQMNILESISRETVRMTLKKHSLSLT